MTEQEKLQVVSDLAEECWDLLEEAMDDMRAMCSHLDNEQVTKEIKKHRTALYSAQDYIRGLIRESEE